MTLASTGDGLALGGGEVAALVVALVLLVLVAALAAADTALTRVTRVRAVALRDEGRSGADVLVEVVDRPEASINPLLLLLHLARAVQVVLVAVVAHAHAGAGATALVVAVDVVALFVLAEVAPSTWAVQHLDRAALLAARPARLLGRVWPLRIVARGLIGLANVVLPGKGLRRGPWVSEDELLAMAQEAAESEAIEPEEQLLIHRIIEFGDTIVRSVMVPRTDMIGVPADFRAGDVMEVVLLNGYSRLPVYDTERGVDEVVGLVFARDLMRVERDGRRDDPVGELTRPATFVPETKRVAELLREMQAQQFHMAIAVDEYGATAGLVTLEDLIEELVGEIVDEFDVPDARVEPLADGTYRVTARLTVDDARDLLGTTFPESDVDTVGGVLIKALGRLPVEGEEAEVDGVRLRAERVQGRRVLRVRVTLAPDEADEEPADRGDGGREGQGAER